MYALKNGVDGFSAGTRVEVLTEVGTTALVRTATSYAPATTRSYFDKDGKQEHSVSYGEPTHAEFSTNVTNLVKLRDRQK